MRTIKLRAWDKKSQTIYFKNKESLLGKLKKYLFNIPNIKLDKPTSLWMREKV